MSDQEIQSEYKMMMNAIASALDEAFNGENKGKDRRTGFTLFVFPFGDAESGRVNYISNGADRRDVVCMMKEMIARFEGQPEIVGNA